MTSKRLVPPRRIAAAIALAGLVSPLLVAGLFAGEPARALLAEGAPFAGRLTGATSEPAWQLSFDVDGKSRSVAAADLVLWGGFVEPARSTQVLLAGGGVLVASAARVEDERLAIESDRLGKISVPLEVVAGILLKPPLDRARRDALAARVASPGAARDRILLDNGDELTGTVLELSPEGVKLDTETGKIELESSRLAAVFYNPQLLARSRTPELRVVVGLDDGSRLYATTIVGSDQSLKLTLPGGLEFNAAAPSVVALQALGGRAVYLSDLKPAGFRHLPFLDLTWPLATDRSVLGGMLRSGTNLFLKGLGMHSPARVTYDLDGQYRRFESEVAIDSETGDRGSVVFRVYLDDGDGRWRERAASEIVRGGEPPGSLTVDLAGAKRISLLVDFADHGDELDHADWLNARLIK